MMITVEEAIRKGKISLTLSPKSIENSLRVYRVRFEKENPQRFR